MLVIVSLGVAAGRADGFVGESFVLDPVTKGLKPAAESILKQPKTVPEIVTKAGGAGGVAAASQAAGVLQAGGLLPALSALGAFGLGVGIGSEVCSVLGIEGCWFHGSDGAADPPIGAGEWKYAPAGGLGPLPAFTWYWDGGPGTYWIGGILGVNGTPNPGCGQPAPGGMTHFLTVGEVGPCGSPAGTSYTPTTPLRYSMQNRVLQYHESDNPGIPNVSYTAPSDWSKNTYAALVGTTGEPGKVGEEIASRIPGSGVASPYALTVEIPNCDGLVYAACEDLLEERGLKVTRVTKTWETADTEADPDEVLELDPAKATEVEKGSTVVVTTNPDEAGMPIVIPAPETGETYSDYAARLNPALSPSRVDVGEAWVDPGVGPGRVLWTVPKPGTRLDPTTGHDVDVHTNPDTAPEPPGTSWTAPAIPSIDLDPLTGVSIGCNTFPFGIFCWLSDGLSGWTTSGACSSIDVPLGTSVDAGSELPFDLCQFEPAMEIIRPVLILVATLCLAWFFAAASMGIGSGSNDD